MGYLGSQHHFLKVQFHKEYTGYEALLKCSLWNEKIKDPHWHPFKIIAIKGQLKVLTCYTGICWWKRNSVAQVI